MSRIANPLTSVRFRVQPPLIDSTTSNPVLNPVFWRDFLRLRHPKTSNKPVDILSQLSPPPSAGSGVTVTIDILIRTAKPAGKPYKFFDTQGLYLLINPTGARWWRFDLRHDGKRKTLSVGTYPDIGLKEARH